MPVAGLSSWRMGGLQFPEEGSLALGSGSWGEGRPHGSHLAAASSCPRIPLPSHRLPHFLGLRGQSYHRASALALPGPGHRFPETHRAGSFIFFMPLFTSTYSVRPSFVHTVHTSPSTLPFSSPLEAMASPTPASITIYNK